MSPTPDVREHDDTTRGAPPRRSLGARLGAGIGAGALVAGCALGAVPAQAAPAGPLGALGTPSAAAAAVDDDVPGVTVTPDPSYAGAPFEGWGTSLVWFANATGDYPDEIRERLADMVFGDEGLNLNIARYNVGGGNAPDVPPYLRAGGASTAGGRRRRAPRARTSTGGTRRTRTTGTPTRTPRSGGGSTASRTRSRTGRRSATPRRGS
ncbi:hypothetical protein [Cellulosimicrobium sp. CUA-896]|uniref:hypothetical protein n=1 Tax=Cellulosimicrobium sp. CUA-896 TaxID=1517881 RepID=UPI000967BB84|nr:hypothetical protein [Cellulosimicrobium sp. CUA-896]OLT53599.1 hypothetical protein BJF88_10560 [Cellulosimicrobium sp. CUA-896]